MAKNKVSPRFKPQRPTYFFRAWRKYRGLTQEALAERVGMSVSAVSQIETGAQGFTDSTLLAFANALTCEPGDLLSRDPNVEGAVLDLMRLIQKKDPQVVMAFINALPDKTGTDS
ncbi:hypothetical protein XM25_19760 [Devosia sp. H5989]|nr:hypothetical protein XM25_19760 [Devosia sp. H5989]